MALLVVRCGEEERGIASARVREVVPLAPVTPLPRAPRSIVGLMGLHGQVVPLLKLAAGGRLAEAESWDPDALVGLSVLIVEQGPLRAGLLVDAVVGLRAEGKLAELDVGALLDSARSAVLAASHHG